MRLSAFIGAVLFSTAAVGFAAEDQLRDIICDAVKSAPLNVTISAGKGAIKEATADYLLFEGGAMQVQLKWNRLKPRDFVLIGREAARKNPELQLAVASYAIENALGEDMLPALATIIDNDPSFAEQARSLRSQIIAAAKDREPPAPVRPIATVPAVTKPAQKVPMRKNHEGRVLGALPKITKPVRFNTPEADEILSAMQIFPINNPWNEDISKLPVLPNSSAMIDALGSEARLWCNRDMNFIIVPPEQPKVAVKLVRYPRESDPGPYPVPDESPIEGWPWKFKGTPLEKHYALTEGDRHMIVLDPTAMKIHEFCATSRRAPPVQWEADCEATFDLTSNETRHRGWTSADAAGLPIFPAIARFDECERGMVEHALRVTVRSTCRGYIWPATHDATDSVDATLPKMGQRFRLKADVKIDHFPKHARAIALALKKYGMIVADHGANWYISVSPDERLRGLDALKQLKGSDFEAVQTTGEHEGLRSRPAQ